LGSEQWAADYNEIKDFGGKASTRRSARQTEDARFWLITGPVAYHPIARQLVVSRKMDVMDSARFMALVAMAEADAYIAVMESYRQILVTAGPVRRRRFWADGHSALR
jgi:hypothetical protein